MREVAERLVLDPAVFAVATAQQMGLIHTALVAAPCGDDMYSASTFRHTQKCSRMTVTCQHISDYTMSPINASNIHPNTGKTWICCLRRKKTRQELQFSALTAFGSRHVPTCADMQ